MLGLSPTKGEGAGCKEILGTGVPSTEHYMCQGPAGGPHLGHWSSSEAAGVVGAVGGEGAVWGGARGSDPSPKPSFLQMMAVVAPS